MALGIEVADELTGFFRPVDVTAADSDIHRVGFGIAMLCSVIAFVSRALVEHHAYNANGRIWNIVSTNLWLDTRGHEC